jgi:hypothetical protein
MWSHGLPCVIYDNQIPLYKFPSPQQETIQAYKYYIHTRKSDKLGFYIFKHFNELLLETMPLWQNRGGTDTLDTNGIYVQGIISL